MLKYIIYLPSIIAGACMIGGLSYSEWLFDNRPKVLDPNGVYVNYITLNNHGNISEAYVSQQELAMIHLIIGLGVFAGFLAIFTTMTHIERKREMKKNLGK